LRKSCSARGRYVNDCLGLAHTGQRRANKRVRSLQQMIGVMRTAGFSKMLHSVL
jgi:hypothetical protein